MAENLELLSVFISNVGFPIFASVGMGWMFYRNRTETELTVKELHLIVENNNRLIQQNTDVMNKLIENMR